jgi:hypothetical protein
MKKIKKEEPEKNLYPNEDRMEILRLFKVAVATQEDLDSIFRLYKKYINPGATTYQTNCNCSISIQKFYQDLLNWYSDNGNKFE